MKVLDIITDNIGPAPAKVCKSGKPDSELPASWLASCRSKGMRRRDSDKEHKIDGMIFLMLLLVLDNPFKSE